MCFACVVPEVEGKRRRRGEEEAFFHSSFPLIPLSLPRKGQIKKREGPE